MKPSTCAPRLLKHTPVNTYCLLSGKHLETGVQSEASQTEPKEKNYGEYIVYYPKIKKSALQQRGQDKLNSYRLFTGEATKATPNVRL